MRVYRVNKIEHTVFDIDEVPEDLNYLKDWRKGSIGDWVLSDDECVIQILRKGTMLKPKGKVREVFYIGTCTGTFLKDGKMKMDADKRENIYSLSGKKSSKKVLEERKKLTGREELFIHNLQKNMTLKDAYINASVIDGTEKDDTRLKALFKLADIMDMEDKNKTQVTQLTGAVFQGFSNDTIEAAERPKEIDTDER